MITKINGVYSLTDEADVLNLPTKGVQLGSLAQLTKDNGDSTVYIFTKDMSAGNTSWVKGSSLTEDEKANIALIPGIKADIREVNEQLDNIENNKTDKSTTQNLQTQVNNLVLASDGTQNAEVVQARGGFPVLNSRLDNIETTITDLNIKRFNLFNKEDITLNKYFGGTIGTSTVNNIGDTTNSFISNQSFKVKKGDVIKVNQQYVGIYIYDNNGILREKYNDTKKEFTVQSEVASFFKISYSKYNDGKIDTLMVVVNGDMPMDYVSYKNISMVTEETKELKERIEILEDKTKEEKKTYILLNFDDQTNMYKNRFEIMKDYGFKFSFCLNSGMQVNNNFKYESEKATFF